MPHSFLSTSNFSLYAKWSPNKYYIEFDGNDGLGTMEDQEFIYDAPQTINTNSFTREGYTFRGWNTKPDGSGTFYADGQSVQNLIASGTLTLHAQWVPNTYNVAFNQNGGTGSMSTQNFTFDQEQSLTENSLTKLGYTFGGWNTESNGSGTSYSNGESVKNLLTSGTLTLYAQWIGNPYTVIFDANSGEGAMPNQDMVYGISSTLSTNEFTKEGYDFAGWSTSKNGEALYSDNESVSTLTKQEAITLYAIWAVNPYDVEFLGGGADSGTMSGLTKYYDEVFKLPRNLFDKTGYTFAEWLGSNQETYIDEQEVSNLVLNGLVTLTAQWTPNTYKLMFEGNGGSESMSNQTLTYDAPQAIKTNAFTKEGYTFSGWNTESDGSGISYTDGQQVENLLTSGSLTLYAQWVANTYEVAFDANGGTGSMSKQSFTYDLNQDLSMNLFTKEGYTFVGWNTQSNATGTSYANSENVQNLITGGTLTLFAQWKVNTYSINIYGSNNQLIETLQLDHNQIISLKDYEVAQTGYHVTGWYYDLQKTSAAPSNLELVNDVALYISISPNVYTVYFNPNNGLGQMLPVEIEYDSNYILPSNQFVRRGYTFDGWIINTNVFRMIRSSITRQDVVLLDQSQVLNLVSQGSVELIAQWTPNIYTVNYELGHDLGKLSVEQIFDEPFTIMGTPQKDGYKFIAWNTSIDGNGTKYESGSQTSNLVEEGQITLYAIWEKVETGGPELPHTGVANSYLSYLLITLGGFAIYLGMKKE